MEEGNVLDRNLSATDNLKSLGPCHRREHYLSHSTHIITRLSVQTAFAQVKNYDFVR